MLSVTLPNVGFAFYAVMVVVALIPTKCGECIDIPRQIALVYEDIGPEERYKVARLLHSHNVAELLPDLRLIGARMLLWGALFFTPFLTFTRLGVVIDVSYVGSAMMFLHTLFCALANDV